MSEQPDSYETARITITRELTSDGDDNVYTSWDEGAPLIELLGLVEYARDTILRAHMDGDEDE